jgi:hypothetical protein
MGCLLAGIFVVPLSTTVPIMTSMSFKSRHFGKDIVMLFRHVFPSSYFSFGGHF